MLAMNSRCPDRQLLSSRYFYPWRNRCAGQFFAGGERM